MLERQLNVAKLIDSLSNESLKSEGEARKGAEARVKALEGEVSDLAVKQGLLSDERDALRKVVGSLQKLVRVIRK